MVATCRFRTSTSLAALIAIVCIGHPVFSQEQPTTDAAADSAALDPELAAVIEQGRTEYLKNCRACHGTKGTAGVPLAGNDKVEAGFDYLGWAIITGPGYMPELGVLSDEQIAQISTYILNSWGNSYGIVTAEDISALR
jgi:mono/diheme cytochrome c family protein